MIQQGVSAEYTRIRTMYCSPDGERVWTYGIAMVSREAVETFPDIDLSAAAVDRLVVLLQKHRVEPCHFRDVVTDYIEQLATP